MGWKEAPYGFCFKAERKHFGAAARASFGWGLRRERRAPGGDCGTSAASRAPLALGSGQLEGDLPAQPRTRPLTPGWGNSLDIKGDQSRGGTRHPGTTFLPLPTLLPVVLFLVTSFSWQQNVAGGGVGGDLQEKARSARDTSRKTMWSAEAGNGLEARVGVGKTRRLGRGGRKAVVASKPETRMTVNATPNIFCHPNPEIQDTAPNPRLGVGRSVRVAVPTPCTGRCRRR